MADKSETYLAEWQQREDLAERMLPLVGALYRRHGIVVLIHGVSLVQATPLEIIKAHRFARRLDGNELPLEDTFEAIFAMTAMDLAPAKVDVGKLRRNFGREQGAGSFGDYVRAALASLNTGREPMRREPQDVVLYGFGRIGRLMARIIVDKMGGGEKFRLRAIVVRPGKEGDLQRRASLLRRDSIHGPFGGTIRVDQEENALVINGNMVRVIYANAPEDVDYAQYGIRDAIVVDNTGIWRDREGLGRHLKAKGVAKVILTAPGQGDVPNIVFGVNEGTLPADASIVSAASCTTNAIVPVLKVINDQFGIQSGHMETVHSYTNDQNLIDNFHKKARRGRAAPLNLVITETGAAKAVAKALPELAGKLTGNAIRVPTPNVSLAILNLALGKPITKPELNDHLRQVAIDSPLQDQIDYLTSPDIVSSDLVGNRHAGIVDATATITDDNRCVLYVWYDNEYGYSCQVMRLVQHMAGVRPPTFPS
ncbi:MAG: glyceraldehyde-3-phosphate dehydrogenase [Sandaracinaceae bacterium]|nr:glyceraldehyde-3-phosphate dehydrogenase [Sandaracinaceae bacterium]